jgi:hypothetical protein
MDERFELVGDDWDSYVEALAAADEAAYIERLARREAQKTEDFWTRLETEKLHVVRKPVRGRGGKHRKYTFKWSDERSDNL